MAGEGLGSFRARGPVGPGGPLVPLRGRPSSPPGRSDRGGPATASLSREVDAEPPSPAQGADRLHAADRRLGEGGVAEPPVRGGQPVAASAGPGGGGPRWRGSAVLPTPASGAQRAAPAQAGDLPISRPPVP